MPPTLRLSLTIFSVGFAFEAGVDAYHLLAGSGAVVSGGVLLTLGAVATVFGLACLWIGRHELGALHRSRVAYAHGVFAAVIALAVAAAAPVGYVVSQTPGRVPGWLPDEVALAVGAAIVLTVGMYVVIVLHLVGRTGRVALALALVAAVLPAFFVASRLATDLPGLLAQPALTPGSLAGAFEPLVALFSWLFASYLFLLVAFADAHWRVAQGAAAPAG